MADDQHNRLKDLDPELLSEEGANEPVAAFTALKAAVDSLAVDLNREMMTIRRGLEFTLDQIERRGAPIDYSAELARINQNQAETNDRLRSIEQAPALKHGPEHYARVLERSGESLVKAAAQQFERQAADLERAGRNLATYVAGSRERNRQNRWLMTAAFGGMLAGIVLSLILPTVLPFLGGGA